MTTAIMARPLPYTPTPVPTDTAHEALEDLIETLHESGTLRVLNGLLGRFADVSEVVARGLDTPGGRNGLANLLLLLQTLGELDPDRVDRFLTGTQKGLCAVGESLQGDPPGLLGLLGTLKDEDVRRGLFAVLTLLRELGRHLHEPLESESS